MLKHYIPGMILSLSIFGRIDVEATDSLAPNIAIQFVCKEGQLEIVNKDVIAFLETHGFKVFDQGLLQRTHGIFLWNSLILGLHGQESFVEFISFERSPNRFNIRLNSRPPTVHGEVERDILKNIEQIPGCEIRSVRRGDNVESRIKMFEGEIDRIEQLFKEGDAIQDKAKT